MTALLVQQLHARDAACCYVLHRVRRSVGFGEIPRIGLHSGICVDPLMIRRSVSDTCVRETVSTGIQRYRRETVTSSQRVVFSRRAASSSERQNVVCAAFGSSCTSTVPYRIHARYGAKSTVRVRYTYSICNQAVYK